MAADGDPGGLLVVSDYPGQTEDNIGRPMVGETGAYLRRMLNQWWSGPVAIDNAVRCAPGRAKVPASSVGACRGYLAQTVREVHPTRILAMGGHAIEAMSDRSLAVLSVRRGYSWLPAVPGEPAVPVFYLPNPVVALRNRFIRSWIEEDLEWALMCKPPFDPPWSAKLHLVENKHDALVAAEALRGHVAAFDSETMGQMWGEFILLCCSFCVSNSNEVWTWGEVGLTDPGAVAVLRELLLDRGFKKVGANIKYDQLAVQHGLGVEMRGVVGDVRLLRKLLESDADGDLETMAELVGCGGHKQEAQEALKRAGKCVTEMAKCNTAGRVRTGLLFSDDTPKRVVKVISSIRPGCEVQSYAYGFLPLDLLYRYNARDTLSTSWLHVLQGLRAGQDDPNITRIYRNVVMPAAEAVKQIEWWGVPVDRQAIDQLHLYLAGKERELRDRLAGYGLTDPGSLPEVGDVLFKKLGLPPTEKNKTGYVLDKDALSGLRDAHPAVSDLIEWRRITRLDGTYARGLAACIRADGRVHPSILVDGARSGRMSCQNPNLQNIPRNEDDEGNVEGQLLRNCFIASPGHVLLNLDFSQLELRIAAMLSGDEVMAGIFRAGVDYHHKTAELIAPIAWGITNEQVTKIHRTKAKVVNFSLVYGKGDRGLARDLGCSVAEAARIREAIFGQFRKLSAWIRGRVDETRRTGCAWTWWDGDRARRRWLIEIANTGDDDRRSVAEHSSFNTPVQGTGSEYLTATLGKVVPWILDNGIPAKLWVPVHDSLMMEVEESAVDEVAHEVRSMMLSWPSMGVPLAVDAEVGQSWGAMRKYWF
jgi:uracil-DNA glycosylase family 4